MERSKVIKLMLPFIEGCLVMLFLVYKVKLEGLYLWIIFLITAMILAWVNISVIYPKVLKLE